VLVVDNLADAADSLAILLRLWGYDAAVCYDGAAALEVAPTYRPQAVLLDVGMPGLDGFEVSRRLRGRPDCASIVIIGVSGYGDENSCSRARLAGFAHYLLKPVEPYLLQELLSRVTRAAEFATPEVVKQDDGTDSEPPPFPVSGQLPTHPRYLRQEEPVVTQCGSLSSGGLPPT
jgi:CheY-like chemotaxis protein